MMDILTLPALAEVHSSDIALLLLVSCLFELTFQAITFKITLKSEQEKELSRFLLNLKYQCAESKLRGPVAFVETSKLERSILAREKEISENNSSRDLQLQKVKLVSSRLNYVLYAIVAAFYWGVPMIILNDVETKGDAYGYLKTYFFPMLFGISAKVSKLGQPAGSIGPLFIVFAGQVTVSEISGCITSIMNT